MNNDEARKIKISEQERKTIVNLTKSVQEKFDLIPKSFFQLDLSVINAYRSQAEKLYETASHLVNSEFIKRAIETAQAQREIYNSIITNRNTFGSLGVIDISRNHPQKNKQNNEILRLRKEIEERDKKLAALESKNKFGLNFGLEILDSGIFKYKGKILSITTNSNPGKFLKQSIENSNHFVPDTFCFENFNTPSSNETRSIIRNIKNKLKKDNLTIKFKRVGDPSGYVLIEVLESQSQIDHK